MNKDNPLYVTISFQKTDFVLHYKKIGNKRTNITKRVYDINELKKYKNIPFVRYDKANKEDVLNSLKILKINEVIKETDFVGKNDIPVNIFVYLNRIIRCKIPVENGFQE